MTDEPFGPVAGIARIKTLDEVIASDNRLSFGLASYAFTGSARKARTLAARLEAGMASITHLGLALPETPFGGCKESGMGIEGASETFDAYLNTKVPDATGVAVPPAAPPARSDYTACGARQRRSDRQARPRHRR